MSLVQDEMKLKGGGKDDNDLEAGENRELENNVAEEESARFLLGHESYNMDTIPEYKMKFGLSQIHMARRAPKDYIMESTNLPHIHDTGPIKGLLRRAEPYKLNVPVFDEEGKLTGEIQKIIPKHSIWVQYLCEHFGGSSASFNRSVGCECLAEPDDVGNQPRYQLPCPTPCDDVEEEDEFEEEDGVEMIRA